MTNPTDARRPDIAALRTEWVRVQQQIIACWQGPRILTTSRILQLDRLQAQADELLRAIREAGKGTQGGSEC